MNSLLVLGNYREKEHGCGICGRTNMTEMCNSIKRKIRGLCRIMSHGKLADAS